MDLLRNLFSKKNKASAQSQPEINQQPDPPVLKKPDIQQMVEQRDLTGLLQAFELSNDSFDRQEILQALSQFQDAPIDNIVINGLKNRDGGEYYRRFLLITACENNHPNMEVLELALSDPSVIVRQRAVEILGKINDSSATKLLIIALKDDDYAIRVPAIKGLGARQDKAAFEPLLSCLNDSHPFNRQLAADALGMFRDKRAITPLIAALSDQNVDVIRAASQSLGLIGDALAVDSLLSHLFNDDVSMYIVRALGQIGDIRALDPLQKARDYNPRPVLLDAIDEAIKKITIRTAKR